MNTVLALVCLLALHMAGSVTDSEWESYKGKYGKNYTDPEDDALRRHIYAGSLEKIKAHNALYDQGLTSYYLGENHLADWTNEEIDMNLKGLDMGSTPEGGRVHQMSGLEQPDSVDWRTKGVVTDVKNQGSCGSCWAFGATGAVEAQYAMKTGQLVDLSEQQLVDCDMRDGHCISGLPSVAFGYLMQYGQESDSAYPYQAATGSCVYDPANVVAKIASFSNIPEGDEGALQDAIATVGPITVGIDSKNLRFYAGGVYSSPSCSGALDHCVLAVGYDTDTSGNQYYIIKNSWGTNWGLEGYFLLSRNNNNMCGIATAAMYPTM